MPTASVCGYYISDKMDKTASHKLQSYIHKFWDKFNTVADSNINLHAKHSLKWDKP